MLERALQKINKILNEEAVELISDTELGKQLGTSAINQLSKHLIRKDWVLVCPGVYLVPRPKSEVEESWTRDNGYPQSEYKMPLWAHKHMCCTPIGTELWPDCGDTLHRHKDGSITCKRG